MGAWITHPTCKCNKVAALSIVLILRGNRGMNEVETGTIKQTPLRLIERGVPDMLLPATEPCS